MSHLPLELKFTKYGDTKNRGCGFLNKCGTPGVKRQKIDGIYVYAFADMT